MTPFSCYRTCDNSLTSPRALRLEHDLFTVVELVLEDLIAMRRLLQWQGVGDDEGGIDFPVLNALEQRPLALGGGTART